MTLLLAEPAVRKILDPRDAVLAVEAGFEVYADGGAQVPPKVYLQVDEVEGDFRAMPARMGDYAGLKWVSAHPRNAGGARPSVQGIYILSTAQSGETLALIDAASLTALRTGAAAAVASRRLARPESKTFGLIGCGVQADTALSAHRALFPNLQVLVTDRERPRAEAFASTHNAEVVDIERAAGCDIVCTMTASRTPIVQHAWLAPGCHINALGADGPGKQELDPEILKHGRIVVDDMVQAVHGGEVNVPIHQGLIQESDIHGSIGEVIAGRVPGREADEVTVFESTGIAVQDIAVAKLVYERAVDLGVGGHMELSEIDHEDVR